MADGVADDYEWQVAQEILESALMRLKRQHKDQVEIYADLIEQLRICELLRDEAAIAVAGVERLLGEGADGIYAKGAATIAKWDALEPTLDLPHIEAPRGWPPEAGPPPTSEPWAETFEDLPPELVEQLSERFVAEHIEPAPAQPLPAASDPDITLAGPFCVSCGGPRSQGSASRCRACYQAEGAAERARKEAADSERVELTDKEKRLFDAICGSAGDDWTVTVSHGRLCQIADLSRGSMTSLISSLQRRNLIRVLDQGDSKHACTYAVCEAARPERRDPKFDEERRIAEMFARAH